MVAHKMLDNDHISTKIALRVLAITRLGEPRTVRVLDAYHGHGKLWTSTIAELPDGWDVKVLGIDKENRGAGTLRGDNLRIMGSLKLSEFDLIDLDAYGWPCEQLRLCATHAPKTPVLTTRIHLPIGPMPLPVVRDLGLDFVHIDAYPLLSNHADLLWEAWLHHLGYTEATGARFQSGMAKRYELLTR